MGTVRADVGWFRREVWLGNTPLSWIVAAAAGVLGFLVVHLILRWLRTRLAHRADRSGGTALRGVATALGGVRTWLLVLLAVAIPLDFLTFGHAVAYWLQVATFLLVGLQVVLCVNRIIVTVLRRSVWPRHDAPAPVMLGILVWACQFAVWVTFLLALLTNAGVNITAFVASLGIGGIAVALALQNILGDLFASVAIGLDKPFEPGEFIAFGDDSGTVRRVGVKTTRIASVSGEELAISNSKLLGLLTHNYSRMQERRVVFGFAVAYDTPRDKLAQIVERIGQLIIEERQVRFDRGHLTGFGPNGFTFEFVYYVLGANFTLYRDIQQRVTVAITGLLDSLGVQPSGTS